MIVDNSIYKNGLIEVLYSIPNIERLEGKTILITGATGMVGCCLIDMLMAYTVNTGKRINVIALARNKDKIRQRFSAYLERDSFFCVSGDVVNKVSDLPFVPDIIIHAASNSHPVVYAKDPIGTIKTNVFGLDNLLCYAVESNVERVLFLSSVEVYGENNTGKERFEENDCGYINCNTLRAGYPESKRVSEALCQAYKEQYGVDVVIARLSRLYGPTMQMNDSKVVAQFIRNALEKKPIVLKSDGSTVYSYTYIVDAVAALITILLKGESGEVYNVADRYSEISILKMAELVARIAGTKVVYEIPDEEERKGYSNVKKSLISAEKLENLGWSARTSFAEGIEKTIQILNEHNR